MQKTLLFLDFLEENGVRVVTFDGRYDSLKRQRYCRYRDVVSTSATSWIFSRKIRANLRFKIQKGEYIGHAPFGYEKVAL